MPFGKRKPITKPRTAPGVRFTEAELKALSYAIGILECDYVDSAHMSKDTRQMLRAVQRAHSKISNELEKFSSVRSPSQEIE
jgi:hypothetical protein